MRSLKFRFHYALILTGMIFFSASLCGQSQMTPKLKEFLTRNDFLDMIEKYGQDTIDLTIKGLEQIKIERRSYNIVQGYRCQVFAGTQIENAKQVAANVKATQLDSVYVIESSENLYRVQVGNFVDRKDAQIMVDKLRYAGIRGAWIVETDIHVPKETPSADTSMERQVHSELFFAVQIFNTKHYEKAQNFKTSLERQFSEPVRIIQQNDLWKVVVGQFKDHDSAASLLESLRSKGFTDAWITQVMN